MWEEGAAVAWEGAPREERRPTRANERNRREATTEWEEAVDASIPLIARHPTCANEWSRLELWE